jgi:hypothetical protein
VGIWDLLTRKRLLVTGDVNGTSIKTSSADVVFGPGPTSPKGTPIPLANRNLSLHTIAKRLVEISIARTNAALPIVLPADIAGDAEREYPGYDLAYVGERLQQLTQVEDGCEVEFRPEFVDDTHAAVQWEMRIGAPAVSGRLGNLTAPHLWEYRNALTRVDQVRDGSQQTFSRFERGAGTERDLLIGYSTDSSFAATWPLLEDAGSSHSSATEQDTLDSWASGTVATNSRPLTTWTGIVRVNGDNGLGKDTDSPPLYEFAVGDTATSKCPATAGSGTAGTQVRILSVANDSRDTAKLSLQVIGGPT